MRIVFFALSNTHTHCCEPILWLAKLRGYISISDVPDWFEFELMRNNTRS